MVKIVKLTKGDARTDDEIIRECLVGRREAYRVLVERYQDRIYNLVYHYVGNHHSAEDISQEAFFKAYMSLDKFRYESRYSTWLYRIAVNKCKDYLKDRRRAELSLEDVPSPVASDFSSHPEGPEDGVLRRETAMTVNDCVLLLPLKYREAFLLRHMEDLSYEEMSAILGLPINTLKMRVFRARETLKKLLKRSGP